MWRDKLGSAKHDALLPFSVLVLALACVSIFISLSVAEGGDSAVSGATGTNSTQRIVEFSEAAKQRVALPEDSLDSQIRDVIDAVSQLPHQTPLIVKEFKADAAGKARSAACAWLSDFAAHGPLDIQSMRTTYFEGKFVTVVAYSTYGLSQDEPTHGE